MIKIYLKEKCLGDTTGTHGRAELKEDQKIVWETARQALVLRSEHKPDDLVRLNLVAIQEQIFKDQSKRVGNPEQLLKAGQG